MEDPLPKDPEDESGSFFVIPNVDKLSNPPPLETVAEAKERMKRERELDN